MSKQNKTIRFLYEASKLLPTNKIYSAIRSHMLIKCSEINPSNSLAVNLVPRCDACGIVFKDVPPTKFIQPVRKPKCYNKVKNGAWNNTKYEIVCLKKFNKYSDKQILITQCKSCKNQIKNTIHKPGHIRTTKIQVNPHDELKKKKKSKNSRRKKNREFSGLKKSAVLSVKRSLETEESNNSSPKKLKIQTEIIDLSTPVGKTTKNKEFSTPETYSTPHLKILTPNTINKKIEGASTSINLDDSDVICLDSPEKPTKKIKNLNDMFTPIFTNNNANVSMAVIVLSDSEVQGSNTSKKRKRKKKKKKKNTNQQFEKIEQTPKLKNNNNVVLVAEQNTADKKKKKLNNLSNFLKDASSMQESNQNNTLKNFLSNFT